LAWWKHLNAIAHFRIDDSAYAFLVQVFELRWVRIKVVQELLRHANNKITMDVYTQALSPAKREAQGRVASIILPKKVVSAVGLSDSFGQLRPGLNSDK
jgi:hypothetical protein